MISLSNIDDSFNFPEGQPIWSGDDHHKTCSWMGVVAKRSPKSKYAWRIENAPKGVSEMPNTIHNIQRSVWKSWLRQWIIEHLGPPLDLVQVSANDLKMGDTIRIKIRAGVLDGIVENIQDKTGKSIEASFKFVRLIHPNSKWNWKEFPMNSEYFTQSFQCGFRRKRVLQKVIYLGQEQAAANLTEERLPPPFRVQTTPPREPTMNEYELEITCACPVDDDPDVYQLIVKSRRTIPVEIILEAVKSLATEKLSQEDLAFKLHRRINACVTLVGYHSGVKVTSTHGAC